MNDPANPIAENENSPIPAQPRPWVVPGLTGAWFLFLLIFFVTLHLNNAWVEPGSWEVYTPVMDWLVPGFFVLPLLSFGALGFALRGTRWSWVRSLTVNFVGFLVTWAGGILAHVSASPYEAGFIAIVVTGSIWVLLRAAATKELKQVCSLSAWFLLGAVLIAPVGSYLNEHAADDREKARTMWEIEHALQTSRVWADGAPVYTLPGSPESGYTVPSLLGDVVLYGVMYENTPVYVSTRRDNTLEECVPKDWSVSQVVDNLETQVTCMNLGNNNTLEISRIKYLDATPVRVGTDYVASVPGDTRGDVTIKLFAEDMTDDEVAALASRAIQNLTPYDFTVTAEDIYANQP